MALGRGPPTRRTASVLPPEIAFLASFGVAPGVLIEAAENALRAAVSPDVALLASGAVAETAFYEALARRLGVAFLVDDPAVAPVAGAAQTIAAGMAPAAGNDRGIRFVLAPRGRAIAALLDAGRRLDAPQHVAITTPRRFAEAVRRAKAQEVAADAVREIVLESDNLSARSGSTVSQLVCLHALSFAVGFGLGMSPLIASFAASIPILVAIFFRLLAVVTGSAPRPAAATRRGTDAELPVYTILVPLFREARVAKKLIRSLDRLDYPVLCRYLTTPKL